MKELPGRDDDFSSILGSLEGILFRMLHVEGLEVVGG